MGNRPASVTVSEIKRTIAGAVAAGFAVGRIEVDHATGKVILFPAGEADSAEPNEWDAK